MAKYNSSLQHRNNSKRSKHTVHVMHLHVQNTSTAVIFLTCSTWPCPYLASITCGQDLPVKSHLGSRKNAVREEDGVCWKCWKGDISILSPKDFIKEAEFVWGSVEVKSSPLVLAEHEHRLPGSSDSQGNLVCVRKTRTPRAAKSCLSEALRPSTCVTSLVKYGN